MYHSFKNYIKNTFPVFFVKARDIKDQLVLEVKTLKQVGISRILKQFLVPKEKWKRELPLQTIEHVQLKYLSLMDLKNQFQGVKEAGHTL